MRIAVPHNLGMDEARRRLQASTDEIGSMVPGGMANVSAQWSTSEQMDLHITAMGQSIRGSVLVEEQQVIFNVDLPAALSFVKPLLQGAIEQQGRKLLSKTA